MRNTVKFTVFAHVNGDPFQIDHHCLDMRAIDKMLIMSSDRSPSLDDLTDENACICCHNVSMVCPGANRMVCPAALAAPMVLLTRVVAPKVCPQMTRARNICLFLSHFSSMFSNSAKTTTSETIMNQTKLQAKPPMSDTIAICLGGFGG